MQVPQSFQPLPEPCELLQFANFTSGKVEWINEKLGKRSAATLQHSGLFKESEEYSNAWLYCCYRALVAARDISLRMHTKIEDNDLGDLDVNLPSRWTEAPRIRKDNTIAQPSDHSPLLGSRYVSIHNFPSQV